MRDERYGLCHHAADADVNNALIVLKGIYLLSYPNKSWCTNLINKKSFLNRLKNYGLIGRSFIPSQECSEKKLILIHFQLKLVILSPKKSERSVNWSWSTTPTTTLALRVHIDQTQRTLWAHREHTENNTAHAKNTHTNTQRTHAGAQPGPKTC